MKLTRCRIIVNQYPSEEGILLTNNILPPPNIVSKATEKNIPLLLVTSDTFQVTRQIDAMEALLTSKNEERVRMLKQLAEKYVDLSKLEG